MFLVGTRQENPCFFCPISSKDLRAKGRKTCSLPVSNLPLSTVVESGTGRISTRELKKTVLFAKLATVTPSWQARWSPFSSRPLLFFVLPIPKSRRRPSVLPSVPHPPTSPASCPLPWILRLVFPFLSRRSTGLREERQIEREREKEKKKKWGEKMEEVGTSCWKFSRF